MIVALAQVNPTVGDIEGNYQKIESMVQGAMARGVRLLVFPELVFTGYPPRDLLFRKSLIRRQGEAVRKLQRAAGNLTIVAGCVAESPIENRLHNSAVVLELAKEPVYYSKQLLPTYDVFDEDRYFEKGTNPLIITIDEMRVGVTVCEDLWNLAPSRSRAYAGNPLEHYRGRQLSLLVNLSSSPFHAGKEVERLALLRQVASLVNCPVAYCNQVGGNDELIFDGCSQVVGPSGSVLARARCFEEDLLLWTLNDAKPSVASAWPAVRGDWIAQALSLGLRDFVRKGGLGSVVVGLSGGIDSSVVAAIAAQALGRERVTGILMPSQYTSAESSEDARWVASHLGIETIEIPIDGMVQSVQSGVEGALSTALKGLVAENIQPRVRMAVLMAVANQRGQILLNTSNKSEIATGYSTQYGDTAGGVSVIGDLLKREVYELAQTINASKAIIPQRVIDRAPTAELRPNQTDQDRLPPYPVLDEMVEQYVVGGKDFEELSGCDARWVAVFRDLYRVSEYKRRQFPPILKVSKKSFGAGRRIPLCAQIDCG